MTTTYVLSPNPKWLFTNVNGEPLASGYMQVFNELTMEQVNLYQDDGGAAAYPLDIRFDATGMQGPFYWPQDSVTDISYLIVVRNSDYVFQFSVENYVPSDNGSGGSGTTTILDLENYIINNTFDNNCGTINALNKTNVLLAAGSHQGFTAPEATILGGDIRFIKNATGGQDDITFPSFAFGNNDFAPTDQTPEQSLRINCSIAAGGTETYKEVQFAICKDLQNFSGEQVTFSFWGKSASSNKQIAIGKIYYFGIGGAPTTAINDAIASFTLTASWVQYTATVTLPLASVGTRGDDENDQFFITFRYPTNEIFDTYIAKPCMYLGARYPQKTFQDPDAVSSVVDAPRTGDLRISINSFSPFGWVPMNDGTIGNVASGATTRANPDTFPLYQLIYMSMSNTLAPVTGGRTGSGSTVAESIADYTADKPIQLSRVLGRVLAGAWGGSADTGAATKTTTTTITSVDIGTDVITVASATEMLTGRPIKFTVSGAGVMPGGLTASTASATTAYYAIYVTPTTIKVALTAAAALAGTAINLTAGFVATVTIQAPAYELGQFGGSYTHTLISAELPDPLTEASTANTNSGGGPGTRSPSGFSADTARNDFILANAGGNQPHNNMQNTVFMNIFAKL